MSFLLITGCRQDFELLDHRDLTHAYRPLSFSHLGDREPPGLFGYRNRPAAGELRRNSDRYRLDRLERIGTGVTSGMGVPPLFRATKDYHWFFENSSSKKDF
jgi:hypothetical protein